MVINMTEKKWKEQAYALFFIERKSINDISNEINVSRQHISKYLKAYGSLYLREKERRKEENEEKRKKYKKKWRQKNYKINYDVDSDTLKREHFEAVAVLSYEKFY